jgi:hypothetical protein
MPVAAREVAAREVAACEFAAGSPSQSILATIEVRHQDGEIRLAFRRCFETHLGLRLRASEVRRCFSRLRIKPMPRWIEADQELVLLGHDLASLHTSMFPRLAKELSRIAWRPLTPRLVAIALNISGAERLRWTKDGRLRPAGAVRSQQGQVISMPTYSVENIDELASHPEIIARWRQQDADT